MSGVYHFLILHSQSRDQNEFGTVAGCVDRPKKLWLDYISLLTGQNVKNNPITTWTCPVKMTGKPKVCVDIVCWPAVILRKWRKKRKQGIFTIFHLFQPCLPRFLAGSSSKLLCTVLSPHQTSWTWIVCCRRPSKLEHFRHPLGRRNQSVLYRSLFLPGSTACKTEEENVIVNTNGGKFKPHKNQTRFSFCAKTACVAD